MLKVYRAKHIVSMTGEKQIHRYMVVKDGKFVFSGDHLPQEFQRYDIVDLAQKTKIQLAIKKV